MVVMTCRVFEYCTSKCFDHGSQEVIIDAWFLSIEDLLFNVSSDQKELINNFLLGVTAITQEGFKDPSATII
jgi:hypothetical protein